MLTSSTLHNSAHLKHIITTNLTSAVLPNPTLSYLNEVLQCRHTIPGSACICSVHHGHAGFRNVPYELVRSEVLPCSFWGHQLSPTRLKHRCRVIRWQKPLLCSKYLLPDLLSPYPVTFPVTLPPATIVSPLPEPTPIRKEISVPLMVTLMHLGLLTGLHTYGATKFKAAMMTSFQT